MRRSKPDQDHTSRLPAPDTVEAVAIGHVRSPYTERFGTPRQPPVTDQTRYGAPVAARIELLPAYAEAAADLAGFDYVWVITWLHLNRGWRPRVTPPRGPRIPRGVLATRAPHRPNPLGLSALRLVGVEGATLHVEGIDLLDGTPVLDVKPYVPYTDAHPGARAGWLDAIGAVGPEPDRFEPRGGDQAGRSPR